MARLTGSNVTVFTIGGTSVLAHLRKAHVVARSAFADATPAVYAGRVRTPIKQGVAIRGALMSSRLLGGRVSHLDVQNLAIGGVNLRGYITALEFEGSVDLEEASGLGDAWSWPVAVHKDYTARITLAVDTAIPAGLPSAAFGSLPAKSTTLALLIDGIAVELDMVLVRFDHRASAGRVQTWDVELRGSALPAAPYPAAPAGTASLLAHAFNAPGTPLSISALAYAGNFLIQKFGFRISNGSILESTYDFASQGAVNYV